MSDTLKQAGADCPKCRDAWPAEYAQMGKPTRWTCHVCGASGSIITAARPAAPPPAAHPCPPWARKFNQR